MSKTPHLTSCIVVGLLGIGMATTLAAQVVRLVPRDATQTFLPGDELLPGMTFDPALVTWTPATRGQLSMASDGLSYEPDADFRDVGIDSFRISHPHMQPQERTVHLVADLKESSFALNPLNAACELDPGWLLIDDGDRISLTSNGDGSMCFFEFALGDVQGAYTHATDAQTGHGGGNTCLTLDPGDPFDPGNPTSFAPGFETALVAGVSLTGILLFDLRLEAGPALVARARRQDGSMESTSPIPISYASQLIELNWWFASASGADDGGLLLLRDGVLEAAIPGVDNFDFADHEIQWKFGLMDPTQDSSGIVAMWDLELWTSQTPPIYEPLFSDSASDGSLASWSDVVNAAAVTFYQPTPGSDPELSLTLSAGAPVALCDDTANAERHYRAAFSVGLGGLAPSASTTWTLFAAEQDLGNGRIASPFRLEVRRQPFGSVFQMRALAKDRHGEEATQWVTLSSSQPRVEVALQWWASQNQASSGGLVLRVDGNVEAELSQLSNDSDRVDSTCLGAMDLPLGVNGQLIVDDFVAWR